MVVQDICSRQPFFHLVIIIFDFSANTGYYSLTNFGNDLRDPIWVVSEISRISKAGYIEGTFDTV